MTTPDPTGRGTPHDPEGTPSRGGDVWPKFLTDNERAIHDSALREPSAGERAIARPPGHPCVDRLDAGHPRLEQKPTDGPNETVGELWHPDSAQPTWQELDTPSRLRHAIRLIATGAAICLALAAWSILSTTAGTPGHDPDRRTPQQVEDEPAAIPASAPERADAKPTLTTSIE
ncbi:hypothetical protein HTV45_06510 [Streptomyces sp. CHD11]|uniref:hypothetical protein n=1 Tax=Streptomyces sp. CHD11 TaxID=2741325 RepID=UPI001BFC866F|nr:hypothetical protein [Streptomyces sp. CHD11]MBT3150540.1 hypothetical protein [Streptomyces sp. CHD11]